MVKSPFTLYVFLSGENVDVLSLKGIFTCAFKENANPKKKITKKNRRNIG